MKEAGLYSDQISINMKTLCLAAVVIMSYRWLIFTTFLLLSLRSSSSKSIEIPLMPETTVIARNGVVATDHDLCSAIGRNVLQEGGHAVDAAVASAICLGVVSPGSSGIGGGAFMLIRSADGKTQGYDMRETAPKKASQNMYKGNTALKAKGVLSIAVPGEVEGLVSAWKKYGRIPWGRLVRPAAEIAENGFKVSPFLHMQMTKAESAIKSDEGLRSIFTSNGKLMKIGDTCHNKQLARTLRLISIFGKKTFYNGSVGTRLVQDIQKAGGILTMEDLNHYTVKQRTPITMDFMGLKILGMPPPSSGGAAMSLILNILAQYHNLTNTSNSLLIHRETEAIKHAFALRMNLGDPDFVNVNSPLKDMLSKDFASKLRQTIFANRTFSPRHYGGRWNQLRDHGTSHISIVDRQRNAVSMTTTINSFFGSKFLSPTTGIILNNEMDDFSIPAKRSKNLPPPAPANFIHPGKRPLSSMAPTIVLKNEKLQAVLGASGGYLIIAGTTQVLLNHFVRGMDPTSSVSAPRVYHQLIPNILQFENWTGPTGEHFVVPSKVLANLQKKGHVLRSIARGATCQFVVLEFNNPNSSKIIAVSDPRKGGHPAGF